MYACTNVVTHTYFSRTAWTSIPEEFHLQAGANVSKHTQTHVSAALNQTERGIQFCRFVAGFLFSMSKEQLCGMEDKGGSQL